MFTKHLLKVIIGFCGMIIFGLVSLVVIDHFKSTEKEATAITPTPEVKVLPKTPVKSTNKKSQTKTQTNTVR